MKHMFLSIGLTDNQINKLQNLPTASSVTSRILSKCGNIGLVTYRLSSP